MKVLLDYTNININQQNDAGITPLYVCDYYKPVPYYKEYKRMLKHRGAESEGPVM